MNKFYLSLWVGSIALASAGVSAVAFADGKNNACAGDIQKLCPSAKSWKDKAACLKQNEAQLTPACTTARQQRKAKFEAKKAAFHQACDSDIQKNCANIPDSKSKPWEVVKCLKNNENSLSDSCKTELSQMAKHHHHHSKQ